MLTYLEFTSDSFSGLSRFHIYVFTPAMAAILQFHGVLLFHLH